MKAERAVEIAIAQGFDGDIANISPDPILTLFTGSKNSEVPRYGIQIEEEEYDDCEDLPLPLAHAGDKKVKRFHFSEITGRLPYVRATVTMMYSSTASLLTIRSLWLRGLGLIRGSLHGSATITSHLAEWHRFGPDLQLWNPG
jgi:hypothetical protein